MNATATIIDRAQDTPKVEVSTRLGIRKAVKADITSLKGVLARAFDEDPFVNWTVRQDARRTAGFEQLFGICLSTLSNGLNETYTTTDRLGAAIWKRPGEWKSGALTELRLILPYAQIIGWSRLQKVTEAFDFIKAKHEEVAPEPHYYLFVLGVEPAYQGQGIGTRLMAPVLTKCDDEGRPAYLETPLERDVRFYRKFGFEVCLHLTDVPHGVPPLWLMRREPRPAVTMIQS